MKNLKKILILVLVCAALAFCATVGALAEDEAYTGTVAELSVKVQAAVDAADPGARYTALVEAADYLSTVDPAEEGYADEKAKLDAQALVSCNELLAYADEVVAETDKHVVALEQAKEIATLFGVTDATVLDGIHTKAMAVANNYLALVEDEAVESTANNQIAVNKLNAFLKLELCDAENDEYKALVTDFEERKALQAEAKEAARQAMLAQGTIDAYSLTTVINTDFSSNFTWSNETQKRGNAFYTADGMYTANVTLGNGPYVQNHLGSVAPKGFVIDFDYTSFGTMPLLHLEGGGHEGIFQEGVDTSNYPYEGDYVLGTSPKVYVSYLKITSTGSITTGNIKTNGNKVLLENAVTAGEWTHMTIIYDPVAFTFSIYCEYEHLITVDGLVRNHAGYDLTYNPNAIRFAVGGNGDMSIDNLQVYQGTALRDLGIFERMSAEESFVYYANYYMNDETADTLGRYQSYNEVNKRIKSYVDADNNYVPFEQPEDMSDEKYAALSAEVEAAVNAVLNYDRENFLAKMRVANTKLLVDYVAELKTLERQLNDANISAREAAVSRIDSFVSGAAGLFDETDEYDVAYEEYLQARKNYSMDKSIMLFNRYMYRYSMVETANSLEKYYDLAYETFNNADAPIDPAAKDLPGFEEFANYYELYINAVERINAVKKNNNAKTIVGCYALISGFAEEEWEANYDYINPYVVMIRGIVAENFYNYDYPGIDKIVSEFAYMDDYFYALLQEVHIKEISERLDYVSSNDAYVEKMGTLSYIERYLENNDIDFGNPEIARLVVNFNTAKDELAFREVDYNTVLKQNASYFVSLVEKMRISDDFNEKRELYDKAIGFYFALDASEQSVKDAVVIFDEHTLWFEKGEDASTAFIEMVGVLQAATTPDEKYAALVQCYVYSLDAVLTYDGVSSAMEIYTAAYNEYNGYVTSANAVIDSTGDTIAAVRANCGVKPVIAVIVKKLFD